MKTKLFKVLCCAVFCAVVLCMGAFAVETYTPDEKGAYTVSYTGTEGQYYAILVVEGTYTEGQTPEITEDSIIYISQETAGAEGAVNFTSFKTKNPVDGTVYIGGSDMDAAVLYGYLDSGTEQNFNVSGTVSADSGSAVESVVKLTAANSTVYQITTTNGAYTIAVPEGTYKFEVTKKAHLSYTKNALEVVADTVKDVELVGGDTDESGKVDYVDLKAIISEYNAVGTVADIDASGKVDYVDLKLVVSNYNAAAMVE